MTPPVTPKMTPAPEPRPRGLSKSSSGRAATLICMARSIRSSSRVVRTTSTSWLAASLTSGVADSYFLAVQGMTETQKMSSGALPSFSA